MFYFTPLIGVLFTFPSRYFFSIGHTGVFSLTRWSSLIHTGFHVPHATRDSAESFQFLTTGLSPSLVQFSAVSSNFYFLWWLSHYPIGLSLWFRLFPFRSPLLGESLLLSFPPATKMFQFAGFARVHLWIQWTVFRVAPFGNLRLNACFQLPGAYRRSLRPSSPLCA
jgi:hypothetical protein